MNNIVVKNSNAAHTGNIVKRNIETDTLDNFIVQYGISYYLKIDVEGYELEVVKGLSTPVSLISVEANLPEFLEETIEIINKLSAISKNEYQYNFTNNNTFILKNFVGSTTAINFLQKTELKYLEVYAKL